MPERIEASTTAAEIVIAYETLGSNENPPLVLVSGTGHDRDFWAGQIRFFSPDFTTIVIDNRGVGKSTVPPNPYSLADMADDVVSVMDHAGVESAHVMGFSMGGHISQELALRHPERVRSLGVHHSWARNSPRLRSFQETRLHLARKDQRRALTEFSLLGLHSHDYYNAHAAEIEEHRRFLLEQSPVNAGWVGQLEACLSGDTFDRLHQIQVPTLVTCSTLDVIAAPHHSREIASRISGAQLVEMPDTGHVSLMEQPEEFASICLQFLQRL